MVKHICTRASALLLAGMLGVGLIGCGKQTQNEPPATTTTQSSEMQAADSQDNAKQNENENQQIQSDYAIMIESNNSWESEGVISSQFEGKIENYTKEAGNDWKVQITIPEGAKLQNSWNGTYQLNGTLLEITPVDYNTEVAAGGEVTFGFILDTKEQFELKQAVLSINGKEYVLGEMNIEEKVQTSTTEQTTEAKELAKKDISGTPVANHGALSIKGTDIVDKDGKIFQLKGISTHGINWFPDYVNKESFESLASYGVNAIRLAMYTADYNGYCSGGNQQQLEALVDKGVQACTELGLYVIIDWHILNDNDPNQNKEAAKTFFDTMSKKYANYDNVIYEICNEPNGGTTWENVKSYSEEVIPVIRNNDKSALIIVGTPTWSQDVDIASQNRIEGQENIIYAAHFYASTHKDEIRNKVETARKNGLPVIISECSICEASGNGSINYDEAQKWMDLIEEYHLSYFAWNLSNKDEQSSILKTTVTKTSGYTAEDFSETGLWFMEQIGK